MAASTASKAKPAKKVASKAKSTSTPSYEAMIKEAILAHPDERSGIGRPTIKKYLNQKHSSTLNVSTATFNNLVNKAIVRGEEKKVFTLPKGISGKVKLTSKTKTPAKAAVAKKDAAPAAPKKTAAPKKAAAATKKPAAKKATTAKKPAAKKASSTTAKAKKPAAKKAAPKKAAAKKTAAKK